MRIGLIVPTLNPGSAWAEWLDAFAQQTLKPAHCLVVDSDSSDASVGQAVAYGFEVLSIKRHEFNHGGTRQRAVDYLSDIDVVILMTQDAILAEPNALESLVRVFEDPSVSAAYGRQLPHKNAQPLGAHARLFNYPAASSQKTRESIPELGLKTCFISNSFAAYRVKDLLAVGGFPDNVILGEDAYVAGRLILAGKKIAYVAEACVFHSHDYSIMEEFRRYFDTGVFHAQQPWIAANFGGAAGEGKRFVISEWQYLIKHAPFLIPSALARTAMKLLGYRLGCAYARLPKAWPPALSMHKGYWKPPQNRP